MNTISNKPTDFTKGQRIEMHPGTDQWMMGARFGSVTSIKKASVSVRLDKLPAKVFRCHPDHLLPIY